MSYGSFASCTFILSHSRYGSSRSCSPSSRNWNPAIISIDRNCCSALSVHGFLVSFAFRTSATDRASSRRTRYRVRRRCNARADARYHSSAPFTATRSTHFRALSGRFMSAYSSSRGYY